MTTRQQVLALNPNARHLNLSNEVDGPFHCIDDHPSDRYLAYGQTSREAAWREALADVTGRDAVEFDL